jgi:hypothetical protein
MLAQTNAIERFIAADLSSILQALEHDQPRYLLRPNVLVLVCFDPASTCYAVQKFQT